MSYLSRNPVDLVLAPRLWKRTSTKESAHPRKSRHVLEAAFGTGKGNLGLARTYWVSLSFEVSVSSALLNPLLVMCFTVHPNSTWPQFIHYLSLHCISVTLPCDLRISLHHPCPMSPVTRWRGFNLSALILTSSCPGSDPHHFHLLLTSPSTFCLTPHLHTHSFCQIPVHSSKEVSSDRTSPRWNQFFPLCAASVSSSYFSCPIEHSGSYWLTLLSPLLDHNVLYPKCLTITFPSMNVC